METIIPCPHCRGHLAITSDMGGQTFACPMCGGQFIAPQVGPPMVRPIVQPVIQPAINSFVDAGSSRQASYSSRRKPATDYSLNIGLGIAAASVLFLGFFCPIISVPIVGGISYLTILKMLAENGNFNENGLAAVLVIAAAIAALAFTLMKQFPLLWGSAIAAVSAMILTIVSFQTQMNKAAVQLERDLDGNPFAPLAQAMSMAVKYDFGLGLIVIGAGLAIAAAVVPGKRAGQ